jgi:hypothetical protein
MVIKWLACGAFTMFLGGVIKSGWTWLLAGYSEPVSTVSDNVVEDMVGNTIFRVGIAIFGVGVLATVMALPSYLGVVVGGVILVDVGRLIYQLNTRSYSQPV